MWPRIRTAYRRVELAAEILRNEAGGTSGEVRQRMSGLVGVLERESKRRGPNRSALKHFVKVTRSYWPGLFACYDQPELPRTNNDLEQLFGSHRYHERRASGRRGASPGLVVRGSVRLVAATATRLRRRCGADLALKDARAWRALRGQLEKRREVRAQGRRFRKNSTAYLAGLERRLKRILPR
jgi:hypothetical protein